MTLSAVFIFSPGCPYSTRGISYVPFEDVGGSLVNMFLFCKKKWLPVYTHFVTPSQEDIELWHLNSVVLWLYMSFI